MIKDKKNTKYSKISFNLEKEVKEQERELKALKQVYELNDINALNALPLKYIPKTKKNSVKIPKKLNELEKEKRKELIKWKEVKELNKIQMTLFKDINNKRKRNYQLNPISQRVPSFDKKFYQTEDFFAKYLNEECDKIFGDNNKNKLKKNFANKTVSELNWKKGINNYKLNIKSKDDHYKTKIKGEFRKEMEDIKKIINNNNEININEDELKDKDFLGNLDNNLKKFYLEKTRQIFDFLKDINLCRYIQFFLNEGYDLFEEFLELPLDFFEKMQNPFLNLKQREKLYQKLSLYKNVKNNDKNRIYKTEIKPKINDEKNKEKIKTKNEIGCGDNYIINKEDIKIKVDNGSNFPVNKSPILSEKFICCWNCLKPLKKENSIMKEYDVDNLDDNVSNIFKYRHFCNDNCLNNYEKGKNHNTIIENEIDKELNIKTNEAEKIKGKEICNKIEYKDSDSFEGDNYDPMDDF